jgi:hypothetical protein
MNLINSNSQSGHGDRGPEKKPRGQQERRRLNIAESLPKWPFAARQRVQGSPASSSDMALSGRLDHFDLSLVFQMVSLEKKTAALQLESAKGKSSIIFDSGRIVAALDRGRTFVSMVVMHLHRLSGLTHAQLMQLGQSGKNVASTLELLGQMSGEKPEVFAELAGVWIEDAVTSLVILQEGQYALELVSDAKQYAVPGVSLPCEGVIMEAVRRADELKQLQKVVPEDQVLVASEDEKVPTPRLSEILGNFDEYILSLIDGNSSVEVLCWQPFCTPFRVCSALAPMIKLGKVVPISRSLSEAMQAATQRAQSLPKRIASRKFRITAAIAAAGIVVAVALILAALGLRPEPQIAPEYFAPEKDRASAASPEQLDEEPQQLPEIKADTPAIEEQQIDMQAEAQGPAGAPKARRKAGRVKVDAEALTARLEKLLANRDYAAVLAACRSLPRSEANKPWPLLCRMRALAGMRNYKALGNFFNKHYVDDGEYHAVHARYLIQQKRWSEAITAAKKATTTSVRFTSKGRVQRDAGYAAALSKNALFEANRDTTACSDALKAWFWVKYSYRNHRNNRRYIEANSRIRELSSFQKKARDASLSGSP